MFMYSVHMYMYTVAVDVYVQCLHVLVPDVYNVHVYVDVNFSPLLVCRSAQ